MWLKTVLKFDFRPAELFANKFSKRIVFNEGSQLNSVSGSEGVSNMSVFILQWTGEFHKIDMYSKVFHYDIAILEIKVV